MGKSERINKNDRAIMGYLLRVKVATIYQLLRDCHDSHKRRYNLVRRLNQLVKREYVEKFWAENKRIYALGRRGIEHFIENSSLHKSLSVRYLSNFSHQIDHDLILTDIYAKLRSLPIRLSLTTHNEQLAEIEDFNAPCNIPDALISFDSSLIKGCIAVEAEISLKTKQRYINIFEMYYHNKEMGLILYLVENLSARKKLSQVDSLVRLEGKSRIFIGLIAEFLGNPLTAAFRSSDERTFCFRQIVEKDPSLDSKRPVLIETPY